MSATILLVEDEEDLASIVQYHLKKMDTQLSTVTGKDVSGH